MGPSDRHSECESKCSCEVLGEVSLQFFFEIYRSFDCGLFVQCACAIIEGGAQQHSAAMLNQNCITLSIFNLNCGGFEVGRDIDVAVYAEIHSTNSYAHGYA